MSIAVEYDDRKRLFVMSPEDWRVDGVTINKIPGARYRGATGRFRAGYTVPEVCVGEVLKITGGLPQSYTTYWQDATRPKPDLIPATSPLGRDLYPYQRDDASLMYGRHCMNPSETGTGKTSMALAAYWAMLRDNMVDGMVWVSPVSTIGQFIDEAGDVWGLHFIRVEDWNGEACDGLCVNYDKVWRETYEGKLLQFMRGRKTVLCLDEAHNIAHQNNRSASLLALMLQARVRWALTATPVLNKPESFWRLYYFVTMADCDQDTFQRRFCRMQKTKIIGYHEQALKDLQTLSKAWTTPRRRKTDPEVAAHLPAMSVQVRYVDLEGRQRELYNELVNSELVEVSQGTLSAKGFFARSLRFKQIAAHPMLVGEDIEDDLVAKLQALDEIVEAAGDEQIVVWSMHPALLDRVAKRYQSDVVLHGKVTAKERDKRKKRFIAEGIKLCCANYMAVGTGVDGLQVASIAVWLDLPWADWAWTQANGRLHRGGQKRPVTIIPMLARGTLDEYQWHVLNDKQRLSGLVTGDNPPEHLSNLSQAELKKILKKISG